MALKVEAKEIGFRNGRRFRQGEQFTLREGEKPAKWMTVLGGELVTPEKKQKKQQAELPAVNEEVV